MRSIVVSMQNMLLSEAVARTLAETGEFRVEQVLPGKPAIPSLSAGSCRRISC